MKNHYQSFAENPCIAQVAKTILNTIFKIIIISIVSVSPSVLRMLASNLGCLDLALCQLPNSAYYINYPKWFHHHHHHHHHHGFY